MWGAIIAAALPMVQKMMQGDDKKEGDQPATAVAATEKGEKTNEGKKTDEKSPNQSLELAKSIISSLNGSDEALAAFFAPSKADPSSPGQKTLDAHKETVKA